MIKKIISLALICTLSLPAFAADVTLEDLNDANIKDPAFRVGLTDTPEKKYVEVKQHIEQLHQHDFVYKLCKNNLLPMLSQCGCAKKQCCK